MKVRFKFGVSGRLFGFIPVNWTIDDSGKIPEPVRLYLMGLAGKQVGPGVRFFAGFS